MEIEGERLVRCPRPRVWAALHDPDVLARAIPGCEAFEAEGPGRFRAVVRASVGPLKARFRGVLTVEAAEPPAAYRIAGEATAAGIGFGRGAAEVALDETPEGTRIAYVVRAQVGGRLAQIGSRLIVAVVDRLSGQFFDDLERQLDGAAAPARVGGAP